MDVGFSARISSWRRSSWCFSSL